MISRRTGRALALGAATALLALTACTDPGDRPAVVLLEAVEPPPLVDAASVGLVEVSSGVQAPAAGTEAAGTSVATSALAFFPELADRAARLLAGLGSVDEGRLDVVAAHRQILGIEVRPQTADGDGGGDVLYGDVTSGATWAARDLLAETSAADLEEAVRAAMADDGDLDGDGGAPDTVEVPDDLLRDLRFTPEGDLVVVAPRGDRAWAVTRPADVALTEAGRLVRGAARQGGAFVGSVTSDPLPVTPATVPLPPLPLPPDPPPPGGPPPVDCAVLACVAITFDDGPGSETPRLLQILADHQARATFYLVGSRVGKNAATAKAIVDAGHALGNHTWNHPDLTTVDPATRASEIARTSQAILEATGRVPTTMRPPYGAIDDAVRADLVADGLPAILWDVDSLDWRSKDAVRTTEEVMAHVRPGSIVLLHDIHASTVDAVPAILDQLAAQGYTFVTVDQLLGPMQPGQTYYARR
ncbi:hypothetical protein C8046_12395 [Serinibacter arcticus]|uniref:NodB homology domain-containing protein n=1 Tax=Serinibacter arcticus TaxID=1655435 RepID=A0A2U1ZWJ0_9MICO|nr:polysaccharide deacetylase family protein [Serinibacter arcticus]PWD51341.1 hypothetical protein C8046_12395 [Serinibacter arcticus]